MPHNVTQQDAKNWFAAHMPTAFQELAALKTWEDCDPNDIESVNATDPLACYRMIQRAIKDQDREHPTTDECLVELVKKHIAQNKIQTDKAADIACGPVLWHWPAPPPPLDIALIDLNSSPSQDSSSDQGYDSENEWSDEKKQRFNSPSSPNKSHDSSSEESEWGEESVIKIHSPRLRQ